MQQISVPDLKMKNIIEVKNVVKTYNQKEHVLKGVDFSVEENTFCVLLGQSGSGKSTLINIMSGLTRPTTGEVSYIGFGNIARNPSLVMKLRRELVSNIFQDYMLLPDLNILENIEIGSHTKIDSVFLKDILSQLSIEEELMKKFPDQLSGGQQQRSAIARSIIKKPKVLFCDEATGALDEKNSKKVVELLLNVQKKYHMTIIFSTHNIKISKVADRIITLKDGNIVKDVKNSYICCPEEIDWGI